VQGDVMFTLASSSTCTIFLCNTAIAVAGDDLAPGDDVVMTWHLVCCVSLLNELQI
jgi:hypothetical protein